MRRKTPLRTKSGFKPRRPLERGDGVSLADVGGESPAEAKKSPRMTRKKPKTSLETHLDIVFSIYIRLRDAMDGGMTRCISCGKVLPFSRMQCGHYFGRANMATRWDEHNCNSECVECNCFNDDHLSGYKTNLIRKIGKEAYETLCERAHETRKWSGDELRGLIQHYTNEARRLSKIKGIRVKI